MCRKTLLLMFASSAGKVTTSAASFRNTFNQSVQFLHGSEFVDVNCVIPTDGANAATVLGVLLIFGRITNNAFAKEK